VRHISNVRRDGTDFHLGRDSLLLDFVERFLMVELRTHDLDLIPLVLPFSVGSPYSLHDFDFSSLRVGISL